jgi:tetratricopeptide (TPR) repeat protein
VNLEKLTKGLLLCAMLLIWWNNSWAQSAKDYLKIGTDYNKEQNYREAVKRFEKAINLEPGLERAYAERGFAYQQLKEDKLAADDYFKAGELNGKKADYFCEAGKLYFAAGDYKQSELALSKSIAIDSKHMETLQTQTLLFLTTKDFLKAQESANTALSSKRTLINTYWFGVVSDSLGDYESAGKAFEEILKGNHLYENAYTGLADVQLKLFSKYTSPYMKVEQLEKALSNCNIVLELYPENTTAYVLRSKAYFHKSEFSKAIDDISRAISRKPNQIDLHMSRGIYYQEFGQQQNAINDYNKVIVLDGTNAGAYYRRGMAYEAIFNHNLALGDYEEALNLSQGKPETVRQSLKAARDRILELNRENDMPEIVVTHPELMGKMVYIRNDVDSLVVNGIVKDKSKIKHIKVNGNHAQFDRNTTNPEFSFKLQLSGAHELTIETADWYDNRTVVAMNIVYTEINDPIARVTKPYASDNGEINLDETLTKIALEGRIEDQSLIRSILINGISASYAVDQLNPTFAAFIDITNKDKISISVTDIYNNESVTEFSIVRQGRSIASSNPMGITWAVFIENTNYHDFASIDGPTKDVEAMKRAFSKYEIHKTIHKKNLTKEQFERFFSIELRDMVRQNGVNSVVVWYAGHGKFVNESGYWIPVDAKRNDEFTYFKVNNLKASLESYSKLLTHTLVVSDACESGPSFYEAMRGDAKDKHCDNWEFSAAKSSQVLTSTGYELAVQKSVFTEVFSQALESNSNTCIPIDDVFHKINSEVRKSNQVARFGKINGLEDQNGTFFFIRKE